MSDDDELFEQDVPRARPRRADVEMPEVGGKQSSQQVPKRSSADRERQQQQLTEVDVQQLEGPTTQQALNELAMCYARLQEAHRALAEVDDAPAWLKRVGAIDMTRGLEGVQRALQKLQQADADDQPEKAERNARLFLAAFRIHHTKAAKLCDDELKVLEGSSGNALGFSASSMSIATMSKQGDTSPMSSSPTPPPPVSPVSEGKGALSATITATSQRGAPPASAPTPAPAPASGGGSAAPPPIPARKATETRKPALSGGLASSPSPSPSPPPPGGAGRLSDIDPFAENPVSPRGRTETRRPEAPSFKPEPKPEEPAAAVAPAASPRPTSSLVQSSPSVLTMSTIESESVIEPQQGGVRGSTSPRRQDSAAAGTLSRGRGIRKGLLGSISPRNNAASSQQVSSSPASQSIPQSLNTTPADAVLEWGSLERPLKAMCRPTDFTPLADTVLRFELQRKMRLLGTATVAVTINTEQQQIRFYDVKQQVDVVRPLSHLVKVTRSNKNARKLKMWWRDTGVDLCERYQFRSGRQREKFYEAVWTHRRVTPQPPVVFSETIEIYIGTWNLGEAMPPPNIDVWLQPNKFDLYVVSAQEGGYDMEKGQGTAEQHFFQLIESSLGSDYVRVAQLSLLHIRMCVYAARRHAHKISNVRKNTVATGIGNVIGNKGACFVSFSFNETSLCFVGTHLAAREERYEQRCQNVHDILATMDAKQPSGLWPDTWFDYMFWTGDLNYRLTAERADVARWARECNVEKLLESDQLSLARRERKAFYLWTEPPIKFSPSYRFDRGSMEFSEEKMRTPSYCDRVLYRCKPGTGPQVTKYDCCHELQTSDHHPVFATMLVETLLPGPAHVRTPCFIEISDLSGKDLTVVKEGGALPFVVFYAPFINSVLSKRAAAGCPNPRWEDANIPRLKPFFSNPAQLGLSHITIAVRDGKNELGQCCIALCDACGPHPADFVAPLTMAGLPAGELRGKVHIKWEKRDEGGDANDDADQEGDQLDEGADPDGNGGAAHAANGGGGLGAGAAPSKPINYAEVLKQGFLLKQGSKVKSWKRRWFVLTAGGELSYFQDPKAPKPLDKLLVDKAGAFTGAGKNNCIAIDTEKRRLLFCADSADDFNSWMEVLATASANKQKRAGHQQEQQQQQQQQQQTQPEDEDD